MSLLCELFLTGFFSVLIACLLAKLFLPSYSCSAPCTGAGDGVCCGEGKRERGEREEDEERIIEVDRVVVEKEGERGLEGDLGVGFEEKGDEFCSEKKKDVSLGEFGLTGEVEFENIKVDDDQGIFEQVGTFDVEKPCEFEVRELGDGKIVQNQLMEEHDLVAESYNLIFGEDQTILRQQETLGKLELEDPVKEKKVETINIPHVEESTSKNTAETVDAENSSILQEESTENSKLFEEFQEANDLQGSLSRLEIPACEIPQEIRTEAIIQNQLENEKDQGQVENLSKTEGPTCKTTPPLMEEKKEIELNDDDDDDDEEEWEGIERSETEKRFSATVKYANEGVMSKLSDEVQLKLYGLRKVAIEGPCYESSSMALLSSTRAKWNAWQRLGNMNPEMAMEQYLSLLAENVPNWTGQPPNENIEEENERKISSDELKNYNASDQLTTESKEGLATSAPESTN